MKSINDIACDAYHAYGKELYRLIGVSQRPWVELGGSEAKCWMAAVQQVLAEAAMAGLQVDATEVSQSVRAQSWPLVDPAALSNPIKGSV